MDTKTQLTAADMAHNRFLGQTDHLARPSGDQDHYRFDRDDTRLRAAQRQWDEASQWKAENDRLREARWARLDAARDQAIADRGKVDADAVESKLKTQYLRVPGTSESTWLEDRTEIIRQYRIAAALSGDPEERAARARVQQEF